MSNDETTEAAAVPPVRGPEATALAAAEYGRFEALLDELRPAEWARPTECTPWDVRVLVAHVLGATEANASPREMLGQLRRGRRGVAIEVDTVSSGQVADRRHLDPDELTRRLRAAVPGALRWRARWSRWAGAAPLRVGAPVHETWRLRYLMDVVYTRDVWMHRVDVCRATSRQVEPTAGHDGRIVADVVADWARRHRRPFTLALDGPAGGRFVRGSGGPELAMDAVEFCRMLSGREAACGPGHGTGVGLLATPVPF